MQNDPEISRFIRALRTGHPREAQQTDALMHDRGFPLDNAGFLWVEALADVTNQLMCAGQSDKIRALFQDIAGIYQDASDPVRDCIDVSYVENLFFDCPAKICKRYWPQLPDSLQRLYLKFHATAPGS